VDEGFREIWWEGVDWFCCYGACVLIVVGVHESFGNGPDIIAAGCCLYLMRRPLSLSLDVSVVHFDGDAAVDDDGAVKPDIDKHVSEQEHVELLPYVPSVRDLTLI
jgi:hypothetical protein